MSYETQYNMATPCVSRPRSNTLDRVVDPANKQTRFFLFAKLRPPNQNPLRIYFQYLSKQLEFSTEKKEKDSPEIRSQPLLFQNTERFWWRPN